MFARSVVRRLLYGAGTLAGLAVFVLATLLLATWIEHRSPLELPTPAGAFAVGRTTFHWVENNRMDELALEAGTPRELFVWAWYPSASATPVHADYLPPAWQAALRRSSGLLMNDFLTRDASQVRAHSNADAGLSPASETYPVVILRAGLAALVTDYTTLAEDLASRGYIVVGFDAPYRTTVVVFQDGRVVSRPPKYNLELLPVAQQAPFVLRLTSMWSADIGFVLGELGQLNSTDSSGRFQGRMDLQHIGIVGHSLGGATAAQFCHDDSRCSAGIDLDGQLFGQVVQDGLRQPFMFMLADHGDPSAPSNRGVLADIQSMYDRLPAGSRLRVFIAGSNHFSFSDQILLKSPLLLGGMRRLGVIGRLEGRRGLAIAANYIGTFFDVHLKGRPPTELDALAHEFPEVRVDNQRVL